MGHSKYDGIKLFHVGMEAKTVVSGGGGGVEHSFPNRVFISVKERLSQLQHTSFVEV